MPIIARYVFALGAIYTVPTQCHTNPAIDTSHPSQAVEERINEIKAVVKELASRDWKKMLHKFAQRHLTGKPKSRYVEAEVAREQRAAEPQARAARRYHRFPQRVRRQPPFRQESRLARPRPQPVLRSSSIAT